MSLSSIKQMKSEKGFTIVELLIVIVVIGILAAIVIVAYNGVQNRANTTSRQSTAETLAKKIEAYNAVKSAYPTYNTAALMTTALNGVTDSSLTGSGIVITNAALAATSDNNTVKIAVCTTGATAPTATSTVPTGYAVYIWDSTLGTAAANPVQAGGTAILTTNSGSVNTVSCGTGNTLTIVNS